MLVYFVRVLGVFDRAVARAPARGDAAPEGGGVREADEGKRANARETVETADVRRVSRLLFERVPRRIAAGARGGG